MTLGVAKPPDDDGGGDDGDDKQGREGKGLATEGQGGFMPKATSPPTCAPAPGQSAAIVSVVFTFFLSSNTFPPHLRFLCCVCPLQGQILQGQFFGTLARQLASSPAFEANCRRTFAVLCFMATMAAVRSAIAAVGAPGAPPAGAPQQRREWQQFSSRVSLRRDSYLLGGARVKFGVTRRSAGVAVKVAAVNSAVSTTTPTTTESEKLIAKPTVLVAEKLGAAGIELLEKVAVVDCSYNLTQEDLCAKISECDALIVRSGTKVTREVFEASKGRLKVVGRAGVGIDNVDLQAATEVGCLVVNAPTANTVAAAEHGISLLTAMARNVAQASASMKAGKWQRNKWVGVSVVEKTLAVMGFGKVGSEVARRAKGLGMLVIAHDPYASAERAKALGVELVSFDEALARADFISLHMPLTPSTDKIFNDESFGKCKKGVRIINVARGGVIDEPALVRALDGGIVAQAALDVFTVEPPEEGDALVNHENVIVTPHLGASTMEAQEGVAVEIAEAVAGALAGELSATAVNAPMVPAETITELAPYVTLAETLGRLAVQLVAGVAGVKAVKVVYRSARADDDLDTRLLRAMIIKGLIEPVSSAFINLVNADYVAKQRGVKISEERQPTDGAIEVPLETIAVTIAGVESKFASSEQDGAIHLEGKVKDGVPYLSRVGGFSVDVSLEGSIILYRQVDQPGMIGKVGTILGEDNVNISFMSVGRKSPREHAVMAIGVDDEPSKATLQKLGDIPAVEEFVFLKL